MPSHLLACPSDLIPASTTPIQVHDIFKNHLLASAWQILAESRTGTIYMDVVPPATEAVGNAAAFEFLRITTQNGAIQFAPLKKWVTGQPQVVQWRRKEEGAVTVSVTLAGVTISYTGRAGNSADANAVALYALVKASTDPVFTAYDWSIDRPARFNADDPFNAFVGVKKTVTAADTWSVNTNLSGGILQNPVPANTIQDSSYLMGSVSITQDLANGWYYFMQISKRTLRLAAKTVDAYSGAIGAAWGDNKVALASMPDSRFATPLELLVGTDGDQNSVSSTAYSTGFWHMHPVSQNAGLGYDGNCDAMAPGTGICRGVWEDTYAPTANMAHYRKPYVLLGSGLWNGPDTMGNDFQIHQVTVPSRDVSNVSIYERDNLSIATILSPPFDIQGWFKFCGSINSESLVLVADTVDGLSTLTAGLDATSTAPIAVVDASKFQAAGFAVIDKEVIGYTGKSGSTLTGITRGVQGSTAAVHYAGDGVSQALWFTIINGSALFLGYSQPNW